MNLHELFDASVLYASPAAAEAAYREVFRAERNEAPIMVGELSVLSSVVPRPIPSDELDLRLLPEGTSLGGAFIGLKLGVIDAVTLRRTVGAIDQLAGEAARMRMASALVSRLLSADGLAVVLHKAAGVVKPARQMLRELAHVSDLSVRPWSAWLDYVASHDGQAFECRSYGMPHFFGQPNVRVVLPAARDDVYALERAMQAVKRGCALLSSGVDAQELLPTLRVPIDWFPAPREVPPLTPGVTTIDWTAALEDDGLRLELTCPAFHATSAATLWDANPASVPLDVYQRALEELVGRRLAPDGFGVFDVLNFNARGNAPPVSLIALSRGDGVTIFVTAGVGRVRAAAGTEAFVTEHAEFCVCVPSNEARFYTPLLNLALVSLSTTQPGGLKDFDGFPPGNDGLGFVVMPLEDLPLGRRRPLPLRQFVPVTAGEYAQYRELDGPRREAWISGHVGSWDDTARRWR